MQNPIATVKTNLVYGVIAMIPISIVFLVLVAVVGILERIADALGLRSATTAGVAIILALILLILVCFLLGALVRTRIGALSMEKLEEKVLNQIPGYGIISNILKGFLAEKTAFPPAMIRLHDAGTAALGFIMEENENGTLTVFVPTTPAITMGRVYVVGRDRVTVLDANAMDFIDSLTQWGVGSGKFLHHGTNG